MTLTEPGLRADLGDEQFARNTESHRALVADLQAKLAAARPGGPERTRWWTRPRRSWSCRRLPRTASTAATPQARG
jgi:hypothetical protein